METSSGSTVTWSPPRRCLFGPRVLSLACLLSISFTPKGQLCIAQSAGTGINKGTGAGDPRRAQSRGWDQCAAGSPTPQPCLQSSQWAPELGWGAGLLFDCVQPAEVGNGMLSFTHQQTFT